MSTLIPSPYQLLHLMKLRSNQQNALLIADGVGVGKTISSGYIIYHQAVISKRSVLIVCPPILVEKWRNEMKTKFTIDIRLANKKDTFDLMVDEVNSRTSWENGPIYITTFSLLSRLSDINSPSFGLLVMDEVHAARNPNIRLYPILKEISQNSEFRVGLSATPINNSVSDLASILSLLMPRYSFQELNSLMEDTWGLPMVRSMSSITTRFTKDQVAHHFTIRDIHNVEIEYPPEYISFVRGKISEKYPWASGFQLETISMHRLAASSPPAFMKALGLKDKKLIEDPKLKTLLEIIESRPNEKWLIFTEFKETSDYIARNIVDRLVLQTSGDSNLEQREANTFLFQETESSVMVMTPVGSEGLDFQFCSNLVNYDLHWNPMKIEQRIGRIDRIGQKKNVVRIYNLLVNGSIDERVLSIMGDKLQLVSGTFADVSGIIDSDVSLSESEMASLAIENETKTATELVKSFKFYNQISSSDNDASVLIATQNCNFHDWSDLDWGNSFPWVHEVPNWLEELDHDSEKFSDLLTSYQIRGD